MNNKFVTDSRELLKSIPDCTGDMARLCLRLSEACELLEKGLTTQEENILKDILKKIGNNIRLNSEFAKSCGMDEIAFDAVTDSAFKKLGNGRVTLVTEEDPLDPLQEARPNQFPHI